MVSCYSILIVPVIASTAKQSQNEWSRDCFVAALLAMTTRTEQNLLRVIFAPGWRGEESSREGGAGAGRKSSGGGER